MKKISLLLVFLVSSMIMTQVVSAQKQVNEATISYKIDIASTDDKTTMSNALEGATLTVMLKGSQSRVDMTSALGTESDIFDSKAGKGAILKQYSGQKLMITLNAANWAQKNQLYQAMKFTIENGEETIAGFKCKKAIGKSTDGKTFTVYFAPDIVLANKQYENAFAQLPGLPVQYELQTGTLKFRYTVNSINYEPVATAKFAIPKTGYRIMTFEENQQLKKGDN